MPLTELPIPVALKRAEHDEGVDVPSPWMPEGTWQASCNFEAEALPQAYGALVGFNH